MSCVCYNHLFLIDLISEFVLSINNQNIEVSLNVRLFSLHFNLLFTSYNGFVMFDTYAFIGIYRYIFEEIDHLVYM